MSKNKCVLKSRTRAENDLDRIYIGTFIGFNLEYE